MKVLYDDIKKEWIELPPGSKEEGSIYLDGLLKQRLDMAKDFISKNWDIVILIDGKEGSGKSILGLTLGWYLSDKKITIDNIAETSADAVVKLEKLPDKSVLIIDEGSMMFSSKEVMSREQRQLTKILNVIRQKSMTLIIISPSFFNLSRYIATERARFLLHVYSPKLKRGSFKYYGERKLRQLYITGKKNFNSYSKPRSQFRGKFTKFEPPFYPAYLETKKRTLMAALKGNANDAPLTKASIIKEHRKGIIKMMLEDQRKEVKITHEQIAKYCGCSSKVIQITAKSLENEPEPRI